MYVPNRMSLLFVALVVTVSLGSAVHPKSKTSVAKPSPSPKKSIPSRPRDDASSRTTGPLSTPSPTPDLSSVTEKQQLKKEVAAAMAAAKMSRSQETINNESVARLQDRVVEFEKRVDAPDSKIEEIRLESGRIIEEANRLRAANIARNVSHRSDDISFIVILAMFVISVIILAFVLVLDARGKRLRRSVREVNKKIDTLTSSMAQVQTSLGKFNSDDGLSKSRQEAEELYQNFQLVMDWVNGLFDEWRKANPNIPIDRPKETITADEMLPDVSTLAREEYVGKLLQTMTESRQIPVSYEVSNSSFVPNTSGKLVVVLNNHDSDSGIVVPNASRLNAPDQFHTYYGDAYRCDNPNVGAMFILAPAEVRQVGSNWTLVALGILEVRA